MKKKFKLENLDCASCAIELEEDISKIEGVKNASVNFATLNLFVEYSGNEQHILENIKKIAKKHDNTKIVDENQENSANMQLFDGLKILASAIFLALALILKISKTAKVCLLMTSYFLVSYEVLFAAAINIKKGKVFDENFLMSIASIGAIIIGKYTEALEVMIFYAIGELLQSFAVNRSRRQITKLMDLKPDFARLETGEIIKPEQAQVGDILLIKAGEKVALDGVIIEGTSTFDARSLTGESLPIELLTNQTVLGGSINLSAVVKVKVTKPYSESSASKIADLIENAASRKSKQESFITKFAKTYTPIVCLLALLTAVVPPLLGSLNFSKWVYRALVFLVVSCPCALVISVPLSFFSGIGMSAREGILIKGGNFLENLAKAKTAVFDKTGTLTSGNFAVTKVSAQNGFEDFTNYLVALSKNSNHPLSKAVTKSFETSLTATKVKEISGLGISATVNGKKVLCGSLSFMQNKNIAAFDDGEIGAKIYTAIDGEFAGVVTITDEIRKSAKTAIQSLTKLGVQNIVMLTGDNDDYATKIANEVGILNYHSKLLPQDKVGKVAAMQNGAPVIFVGDGINDAPVLMQADAGISLGGVGSDAAVEASDIVIINDDLNKISLGVKIARRTIKIVKQNIFLALFVKIAIMGLSFFGLASMQMAVFADVGVMLIAVLNSLRNFKKVGQVN